MLTQEIIVQQEQWLLEEMDQVETALRLISGRCAQRFDGVGDVVDKANHVVEVDTDWALQRLYQQKLWQLEQARAKSRTGQYGICESCDKPIDPARLEVMPYATTCVSCQRQKEAAK